MQGRDPIVYAACRHSPCRSFFIPNLVVFDGIHPYLSVILDYFGTGVHDIRWMSALRGPKRSGGSQHSNCSNKILRRFRPSFYILYI